MRLVLPTHVVAAALVLVSGFVALSAMKGARLHRRSGILFVYASVAMCVTGTLMTIAKGDTMNAIVAVTTAYLVITGLTTVCPPSAGWRRVDAGLMLVAIVLGLTTLTFGLEALATASGEMYGYPAFALFMLSAVGLLGGAGDLRMIRLGGLRGAPRLVRHLWRMCWALWLSALSFLGRAPAWRRSFRSRSSSLLCVRFQYCWCSWPCCTGSGASASDEAFAALLASGSPSQRECTPHRHLVLSLFRNT